MEGEGLISVESSRTAAKGQIGKPGPIGRLVIQPALRQKLFRIIKKTAIAVGDPGADENHRSGINGSIVDDRIRSRLSTDGPGRRIQAQGFLNDGPDIGQPGQIFNGGAAVTDNPGKFSDNVFLMAGVTG